MLVSPPHDRTRSRSRTSTVGASTMPSRNRLQAFDNMKTIIPVLRTLVPALLALSSFAPSSLAQDVSIPDPGLNDAIRETLGKPVGPLTAQDMLGLKNLDARSRSVS